MPGSAHRWISMRAAQPTPGRLEGPRGPGAPRRAGAGCARGAEPCCRSRAPPVPDRAAPRPPRTRPDSSAPAQAPGRQSRTRLGDEPLGLGDLHCATGKRRGGAIVVPVLGAGDQRQHRQRGHDGERFCGWRDDPDQLLQPRPSLRRVSGQVQGLAERRRAIQENGDGSGPARSSARRAASADRPTSRTTARHESGRRRTPATDAVRHAPSHVSSSVTASQRPVSCSEAPENPPIQAAT